MCVLTSTAIAAGVSVALGAVSTTLGVVSSIQKSKAQEAQYNYQAQVQAQNEKIARENAKKEAQEGLNKERLQRMKNIQALGFQKASLASKGSDINFGTSLDLLEDSAMGGELDVLNIRYDTQKRVNKYNSDAANYMNQSNYLNSMADYTKKNALTQSVITGLGGLTKSISSLNGLKIK